MSTKILVRHNGPLVVEGEITLVDASEKSFGLGGRTRISLCRCGNSANKPFCDGTHGRIGFTDTCTARDLPPPAPKP
jgi:CDGSH-type Zn-finger protein